MTYDPCGHPSEAHPTQLCLSKKGHARPDGTPTPHSYSDCSWCAYTYEPRPVHEPNVHALHQALADIERMRWVRHWGPWLRVDVRLPLWSIDLVLRLAAWCPLRPGGR